MLGEIKGVDDETAEVLCPCTPTFPTALKRSKIPKAHISCGLKFQGLVT